VSYPFFIFGLLEFLEAKENEEAEWKPEKKTSTLDYRRAATSGTYEIPYIFLYFRIVLGNGLDKVELSDAYWTEERINNTLFDIIDIQGWVKGESVSIRYVDADFNIKPGELYFEEVVTEYSDFLSFSNIIGGFFRLKLSTPQEEGMLGFSIPFSGFNPVHNQATINFQGFYVGLSRDKNKANFAELMHVPVDKTFSTNEVLVYDIDYDEKVIHILDSDEPTYYISTEFGGQEVEDILDNETYGELQMRFSTSRLVEVWSEYIEYGYTDWITAMGGMLSISSVVFFWGAYFLALILGDRKGMGILPKFYMVFSNYEDILSIKEQQEKGHLVSGSY